MTIGNASRDPRPSDPPGIVFYPIAKDYFCFDTNPANQLPNLTLAQAQAIWTGAVRDWSQVPGARVTGTIDLIGRTAASSLPPLVQQLLLGNKTISRSPRSSRPTAWSQQSVATDKNAIGFNSGWYAAQKNVHAVAYNGVACNLQGGEVRPVPGRAHLLRGDPRPRQGRGQEVHLAGSSSSKAAKKIITRDRDPAQLVHAAARALDGPAGRAAPRRRGLPGRARGRRRWSSFVAVRAWPTLAHNDGVAWLGPGRQRRTRSSAAMIKTGQHPPAAAYHLRAWPLRLRDAAHHAAPRWPAGSCSRSSRVDLHRRVRARAAVRAVVVPAVRLLAAVPSVIYGLIGILVLAPFVGNHLIGEHAQALARLRRPARRHEPARRRRRADGDDHADHDRDRGRRPAGGPARRGPRARPRSAPTAGRSPGRCRCAPRGRRSSPPPCSPAPARWARP